MYGFMDNYFGNVGRRNGLFEQFGMPYGNRQYGGQQQQQGFNPQQPAYGMFRNPMQQGGNVRQQQSIGNPNMAPFNGQLVNPEQKINGNPSFQQPQNPLRDTLANWPRMGMNPGPPSSMKPTMEDYTMSDGTVRPSQVPTMFNGRRYMYDGARNQWNDMDSGMAHAT